VDGAGRQAARVRREAIGFARDSRRAARRHRKRLGEAREALEAAAAEVELAAAGDDVERLSGALQRLDGLWDQHLAFARGSLARRLGVPIAIAAVAAFLLRACVAETLVISSGSMVPTLIAGDRVLVWKPAYGLRVPFLGARFRARCPLLGPTRKRLRVWSPYANKPFTSPEEAVAVTK